MRPSSTEKVIFFLHIQKTAGTSVRKFLEAHFHQSKICPFKTWPELSRVSPAKQAEYKLFYGQHPVWLLDLMPSNCLFSTVLRDPVERTLSHFNYLKSELAPVAHTITRRNFPEFYFCQEVFGKKKSFEDMLEDFTYIEYYVLNYQTRFLSRSPRRTGEEVLSTPADLVSSCSREILERAMSNLKRIEFVGTVDKLEQFLLYICHKLEWLYVDSTPVYNVSNSTSQRLSELSEKTVKRIRALTRLDQELFDFASQLVEERSAHLSLSIEGINASYPQILGNLRKEKSIAVDFDAPFFGAGWHQREWDDKGAPFRWTGPGTSSYIDFPIAQDQELILSFRISGSMSKAQIDHLKVAANECPLDLYPLYIEPDGLSGSFFASISREVLIRNSEFCRITFETSETLRPNGIDPDNLDNRALGLCFNWIQLGPRLI